MTAIQAMMSPLHRHWALYKKSRSGNGSGLDSVLALVWPDGEELLQVNWTVTFWGACLQCIAIFCFYWICSAVRGPRIDIHSASLLCPCICTSESQLMGILTPFKQNCYFRRKPESRMYTYSIKMKYMHYSSPWGLHQLRSQLCPFPIPLLQLASVFLG